MVNIATTDVAIAGGGMVGLSLAIALARGGVDVVVVDREAPAAQELPAYDGRVSAMALDNIHWFQSLGLWERLAPHAEAIQDIRVSDDDSFCFLHFDHREVGTEPFGYIVENRHTRQALHRLAAALPNLKLIAPSRIECIERTPGHVRLTLNGGEEIRAMLLVGADGKHSFVREWAGIKIFETKYKHTAIVCTIAHTQPHHGLAQERFLPVGPFAALPMQNNHSSLVWTELNEAISSFMAMSDEELAREVRLRTGDYLGEITIASKRFSYPLSLMCARDYVAERVALVGDAAHSIHPIAGQGVNLGYRDAKLLAEALIKAKSLGLDLGLASVLAPYARLRKLDNLSMIAMTDFLNRLFSNNVLPITLARRMGLWGVSQIPPLKKFFMKRAMGV